MEKENITEENTIISEQQAEFYKQWDQITISNDFAFCKVMQDEELLAELVHMILPDIKFQKLSIHAQQSVETGLDIHGVRFDIFVMDETGRAIEIEMQVIDTGSLPKRVRYYVSMADQQMLEKGQLYSKLKDSYVIMICPFDQYGLGLHKYTFTNRCHEAEGLEMNDGTTKIILNAVGTADDIDPKLEAFLDYVAGKGVSDDYTGKLEEAVKKARLNKEWRKQYMTMMMRDLENQEIGEKKGEKKGADMLAILLQQLDKESEDFQLAISGTSEDRERLFKKYKIVYKVVGEEEKKDDKAEEKKD